MHQQSDITHLVYGDKRYMTPTPQQNYSNIKLLNAELGSTRREFKVQLGFQTKQIDDIKNNDLKHIADDIKLMKKTMDNKLTGIYKQLNKLNVVDKKGEWLTNLGKKTVETIIIAIVVAFLIIVGLKVR